jgi:hypothetical protein
MVMKSSSAFQLIRFIVIIYFISNIAEILPGQYAISTKAGVVQFIEGDVFLEDKPLQLPSGGCVQIENNQSLRTGQNGRAELLLNPNVYLRIGENSLLRMNSIKLLEPQLSLEQGSALLEVLEENRAQQIILHHAAGIVEIKNIGLYRLDAASGELHVYSGTAFIMREGQKTGIKSKRMIRLGKNLASTGFNTKKADALHLWAAKRSFDLFISNQKAYTTRHWLPLSMGWFINNNYRMRFFSEASKNIWMSEQQKSADAAAERNAEDARTGSVRYNDSRITAPDH